MSASIFWALGVVASVISLALAAAGQLPYVHLGLAALVPAALASSAWRKASAARIRPETVDVFARDAYQYMALLWMWAALALIAVYGTSILTWREWWRFVLLFAALAGVCAAISVKLNGGAEGTDASSGVANGARIFALVLCAAAVVAAVGLMLHDGRSVRLGGKLTSFQTAAGQRAGWQDWSANHVFFFGAASVAALAWQAFGALRRGVR